MASLTARFCAEVTVDVAGGKIPVHASANVIAIAQIGADRVAPMVVLPSPRPVAAVAAIMANTDHESSATLSGRSDTLMARAGCGGRRSSGCNTMPDIALASRSHSGICDVMMCCTTLPVMHTQRCAAYCWAMFASVYYVGECRGRQAPGPRVRSFLSATSGIYLSLLVHPMCARHRRSARRLLRGHATPACHMHIHTYTS